MKKEQYLGMPPYNEEAERSVLSAILNRPIKLIEVKSHLTSPEHFYVGSHSAIYSAMLKLSQLNQNIDLVNISTYLRENELLESAGGYSYLTDIIDEWHPAYDTQAHVKTVESMYLARESIKSMAVNTERLYEEPSNAENIMNEHCNKLSDFLASRTTSGLEHCKDSVYEVFENFSRIKEGDFTLEKELKVNSGFSELDERLNGFRRGSLYIFGGRPAQGKTSLMLNIATNVAKLENQPVAVFSLEMLKKELMTRIVCGEAEVPIKKLQFNLTNEAEFKRFANATAKVSHLPIYIDDKDISSVSKIKAKLQSLRQKHKKLGMVIIDYLQLMQSDDPKETNPTIIFDKISRDLKRLAVDFDVPVLVLSQLSREVEKRNNKRPIMADLRNSGQIEANANVIMFIYRDEYYNPDEADAGSAELIVAKNREGSVGTIDLFFDASITKFSSLEKV